MGKKELFLTKDSPGKFEQDLDERKCLDFNF